MKKFIRVNNNIDECANYAFKNWYKKPCTHWYRPMYQFLILDDDMDSYFVTILDEKTEHKQIYLTF